MEGLGRSREGFAICPQRAGAPPLDVARSGTGAPASSVGQAHTSDYGADDMDAYIATFIVEEQNQLASADVALDLAILMQRAREHRGLSQAAAASRAGLKPQAVKRLEYADGNDRIETLRKYLGALGYAIEISVVDAEIGEASGQMRIPP